MTPMPQVVVRFNGAVNPQTALELALEQAVTVTALVEDLVGEPIDAHDRRQVMIPAGAENRLGVAASDELLRRSAVLRGRWSQRRYLEVESLIVPGRLPEAFFRALEAGNDPIGRILAREKIVFTRTPLPAPQLANAHRGASSATTSEPLLARSYRIEVDTVPVMVVAEWFLVALEAFLR